MQFLYVPLATYVQEGAVHSVPFCAIASFTRLGIADDEPDIHPVEIPSGKSQGFDSRCAVGRSCFSKTPKPIVTFKIGTATGHDVRALL